MATCDEAIGLFRNDPWGRLARTRGVLAVEKVHVCFDFHELGACYGAVCSVRSALSKSGNGGQSLLVAEPGLSPSLGSIRALASDSFLSVLCEELECFADGISLGDRGDRGHDPIRHEFALSHDQMVVLAGCLLWGVGRGFRRDRLGRSVLAMIGNRFKDSSIAPASKVASKLREVG